MGTDVTGRVRRGEGGGPTDEHSRRSASTTAVEEEEQFIRLEREPAPPEGLLNTAARVEGGHLSCGGARNAIDGIS